MSSPAGTPNAVVALTAREIELLAIAMQSMRDPNVQLDYDKFAEMAGLTVGSARVIWGKIRRKLAAASGIDGTPAGAASQVAKPKVKKGTRKRKAEDAGAGAGDGETIGSPQSPIAMAAERKKKRAKKLIKAEVSAQGNEEERVPEEVEDGIPVKAENEATVKAEESNEGDF